MLNLFYRNRQLLLLTLTLILVWGLSAFFTLPRLEDPEIVQRAASITTFLPGASAERVESLVTDKIETELLEIEEIDELESTSSPGVSVVIIELKENVVNVAPVWARVRSKLQDVEPLLPPEASEPDYEDIRVKASALIVGLTWTLDSSPNYTILGRVAMGLEDRLRAIPGTDRVELFGEPTEEIQVEIAPAELVDLGLTVPQLAQQIQASDAKVSAGQLRGDRNQFLLEVDSALQSLERVRQIPIQVGNGGQVAQLGTIAQVSKGVREPVSDLTLVQGQPAVVLSATVESGQRVDQWAAQARQVLEVFQGELSDGLGLAVVLDQSRYVQARLNGVIGNLMLGSVLVVAISFVLLGWQSALIVGSALPLVTLMVFGGMKVLGIPLHQMSVTGLIIALGLLIDNAIIVVDEVQTHLKRGLNPAIAVQQTGQHLAIPLLASTFTTVLAFLPIALSPGGTGEFIGTIGSTVILALCSSLALSLTVIAALTGRWSRWRRPQGDQRPHWYTDGLSLSWLTAAYRWSLRQVFRRPVLGIVLSLVLPLVGLVQMGTLEQQFFPPTNRDQFQVQVEFPAQTAIAQTQAQVMQIRDRMRQHPEVEDVHWFLGQSAPSFFYNVVGRRRNAADYGQGIVQLRDTQNLRQTIQTLQTELDQDFPDAQILVKQLEQGPPFGAPIEVEIFGPDMAQLRAIGNQLRAELAQIEGVIHTRADLTEALPKLALTVDEAQARRAGLDNGAIANQLNAALEGTVGGSILEATEDLPVRVRLSNAQRSSLDSITSLELLPAIPAAAGRAVPFSAVAQVDLVPDIAAIPRRDGQRFNTVQGYLAAGELPDTVLKRFQQHLEQQGFTLPTGYRLSYGGEADARGTAVGNLLSLVGVLLILMTATLVLSFNSFALAGLIAVIAVCSIGLGALALKLFGSIFGFTAILGTLGLVGLAINDSIVVLAALREDPLASQGDVRATQAVVLKSTRHVIATTLTTIMGFVPLMLDKTGFWPPLAIAIGGGLGGATLLALYFIPSAYLLLHRQPRTTVPMLPVSDPTPVQS